MDRHQFSNLMITIALIVVFIIICINACYTPPSKATPIVHAISINGPSGVDCFALTDGNIIYGGNCK